MQQRPEAFVAFTQWLALALTAPTPRTTAATPATTSRPEMPHEPVQASGATPLRAMAYQRQELMSSAAWLMMEAWRTPDGDASQE